MSERISDLDHFAIGAGIGLAGRVAGRIVGVLAGIVAARLLGPAAFGVYAIGLTIFRLIELISPLGFDVGVIRYGMGMIGRDEGALKGIIFYSIVFSLLFSTGLGVGLFIASPWLARAVFFKPEIESVLRLFALVIPLSALVGVLAAITRLTRNMAYSVSIQDLGQPLLSLSILGIFVLTAGLTLNRLVVADLLSYGLVSILGLVLLTILFPPVFSRPFSFRLPEAGYYSFSFGAALVALLGALVFWVDRLFAGSLLTATEVGYYQSASQLSVVFAVVISGFNRILMPLFSSLYHDQKMADLEELYRIGTKWTIYVSLPVLLVLLLMPGDVLALVYKEEYSAGAMALVVLLLGQVVNLMTGSIGPLLLAGGQQRAVVLLSLLVLGANALACRLLIPIWGIVGAALANALCVALLNISGLVLARKKMNIWPYDRRYLKPLGIAAVAGLAAGLFRHFVPVSGVAGVAAVGGMVVGIVGAGLVVVRPEAEDRALLRLVMDRLKGPKDGKGA